MSAAWYSVVQYQPRLDRAEGANVGVLLFVPGVPFLDIRMARTNARVRQMFGRTTIDNERLKMSKQGLRRRVLQEAAKAGSVEELRRVLRREGNQLQFGPLLETKADAPDERLRELFSDLVSTDRVETDKRPRRIPEFELVAERLAARAPVERDVTVCVPFLEKDLQADLAYQNGKRNIVKAQWFHKSARKRAADLGSEGLLIEKTGNAALIIVSKFDDPEDEHAVQEILRAHGIRNVPVGDLDEFEKEVLASAHE